MVRITFVITTYFTQHASMNTVWGDKCIMQCEHDTFLVVQILMSIGKVHSPTHLCHTDTMNDKHLALPLYLRAND